MLDRVSRYTREVVHEARKVVWLTYRQTVTYTVVVVVAVAVLAAFMYGFDALLNLIGRGISGAV